VYQTSDAPKFVYLSINKDSYIKPNTKALNHLLLDDNGLIMRCEFSLHYLAINLSKRG